MTLLEIVFACAFLALIMVLVFTLFDRNVVVSRRATSADQRREESRQAMDSIIVELREAGSISAPAVGETSEYTTFTRPGSDNAKRKGQVVTYSFDAAQKRITRSDNSGSGSVVVMEEVNSLTFRRVGDSLVEIEITTPYMESEGGTSEYTIKSRASIRKLVADYSNMSAPAEIEDDIEFVVEEMGGLW